MKHVFAALLIGMLACAIGCQRSNPDPTGPAIVDQIDETAPSEDVSKGIDAALEKFGKEH